jgi:hypothetical protein
MNMPLKALRCRAFSGMIYAVNNLLIDLSDFTKTFLSNKNISTVQKFANAVQ